MLILYMRYICVRRENADRVREILGDKALIESLHCRKRGHVATYIHHQPRDRMSYVVGEHILLPHNLETSLRQRERGVNRADDRDIASYLSEQVQYVFRTFQSQLGRTDHKDQNP